MPLLDQAVCFALLQLIHHIQHKSQSTKPNTDSKKDALYCGICLPMYTHKTKVCLLHMLGITRLTDAHQQGLVHDAHVHYCHADVAPLVLVGAPI